MVKFLATDAAGSHILGLGLSAGNLSRLREGMPILIKKEEVKALTGCDNMEILILYGDTEEDIKKNVEKLTGESTEE